MRIDLNKQGKHYLITFALGYYHNGNLAIRLIDHENGYPEPYGDLTVNLNIKCEENCAFIDTNNNGDEIIEWLLNNKLGLLTGRVKRSGFCLYPEFVFFPDELQRYTSYDAREMM